MKYDWMIEDNDGNQYTAASSNIKAKGLKNVLSDYPVNKITFLPKEKGFPTVVLDNTIENAELIWEQVWQRAFDDSRRILKSEIMGYKVKDLAIINAVDLNEKTVTLRVVNV